MLGYLLRKVCAGCSSVEPQLPGGQEGHGASCPQSLEPTLIQITAWFGSAPSTLEAGDPTPHPSIPIPIEKDSPFLPPQALPPAGCSNNQTTPSSSPVLCRHGYFY